MHRNSEHAPSPLGIKSKAFRQIGHWLVDQIADHFEQLPEKRLNHGDTPGKVREALGGGALPEQGEDAGEIIRRAYTLLMNHSLLDGHPRFWGYIIGSGTQIGALADLLAATVNPNVGSWILAPMASEIEAQTVRWIAGWIGYPADCGGILVSGGAMANYVGFLAARRVKAPWNIREQGLRAGTGQLKVYCSTETHTWIQKATDAFGFGTDAIAWIPVDQNLKMDVDSLDAQIKSDKASGDIPFMVIGTAGTVSTGVVDDLDELSRLCKRHDLWFHVDGAYGAPAAHLEENAELFKGLTEADSVALDPHKWFYSPQEAGCVLVRERSHLLDTFSYRPPYYHFDDYGDDPGINYYEYGLQNSRGFRALKVWMGLLQAGRAGLEEMIRHDIEMAQLLYQIVDEAGDFEAFQTSLSITTFRYKPMHIDDDEELNALNEKLLVAVQNGGKAFISNAVSDGKFLLRACFVNFRTRRDDIVMLPEILRETARYLA